jgi:hypothetical protein
MVEFVTFAPEPARLLFGRAASTAFLLLAKISKMLAGGGEGTQQLLRSRLRLTGKGFFQGVMDERDACIV